MQMTYRLAVAAMGLVLGVAAADGQSLRNTDGPAEYPPASYSGKQYVDSKGCVFIRAGYGGNVTWVPRVSRNRKVVCGFAPTFAASQPAAAPPPRVAAAPAPARPAAAPPPRQVVAAPKPAAPPPRAVAAPARTPAVRAVPSGAACPNLSPVGQRLVRARPGYPVRCGSQAEAPTGGVTRGSGSEQLGYAPPPVPVGMPPAGFRAAFDDGRLNPHRGPRTAAGDAQMAQVWSNDLPRRLLVAAPD